MYGHNKTDSLRELAKETDLIITDSNHSVVIGFSYDRQPTGFPKVTLKEKTHPFRLLHEWSGKVYIQEHNLAKAMYPRLKIGDLCRGEFSIVLAKAYAKREIINITSNQTSKEVSR